MIDQNIQHKIMTHLDTGKEENGWYCTCGESGYPDTQESRDSHLNKFKNHVKKMIYLASPHSHTSEGIRNDRYVAALNCASWLIERGFWVFSPIVHSHNLPCNSESNIMWEFWKGFDTETITRMDEFWILVMPGTMESKGVLAEIEIAKLQGKNISLIWKNDRHLNNEEYLIQNIDKGQLLADRLLAISHAQASRL